VKSNIYVLASINIIISCFLFSGCAVGPEFRTPDAPVVKTYTEVPLNNVTAGAPGIGGAPQSLVPGQDLSEQWWTLYRCEALDRLIRLAISESPTLASAQARLREAQENLRARTGTVYFPSIDGSFSARRQKTTGASIGQPQANSTTFNLFSPAVSFSYVLDVFGGGYRELEALKAQVDYQSFQREGAYLALTSSLVTTAVQEASLREQIMVTQRIINLQEEQLVLIEKQLEYGGASRSDVLSQQSLLAQTRVNLSPLEKQLALTRHLLAVLAGRFPGDPGLPEFRLKDLQLPIELPVSLPSSLVRQRPDIVASEALLHVASAQVGVATANLYPKINLTGSIGYNATRIEDLFSPGTSVWSLGAGLVQPLFHGGELTAKRRAAIAAYDQANAVYRDTVLHAFRNVADVLHSLDQDANTLKSQSEAAATAAEALEIAQTQFKHGAIGYLSLLNAERQHQQAQISLVQAQAARFSDTATLFQALGGGWWNKSEEDLKTTGIKE